jgi:hypothetical protein
MRRLAFRALQIIAVLQALPIQFLKELMMMVGHRHSFLLEGLQQL